jgi:hypothetical protein
MFEAVMTCPVIAVCLYYGVYLPLTDMPKRRLPRHQAGERAARKATT